VLLPLRIEDVLPEAALEYYLGTPHWLDAITKPFETHLEKLADACTSLLAVTGRSGKDADQGSEAGDRALTVRTLLTEQPSAHHGPPMMLWWRRQRRQVQVGLIAATVVILAATAITGYLVWRNSPASPTPTAQPSTTAQHPTTTQTVPPVQQAGLEGLLLNAAEVNTTMGATGMIVADAPTVMDDNSAVVPDQACRPLASVMNGPSYAGSRSSASREQLLHEPGGYTHSVDQGVVLFSTAHDAAAFFTASAQQWPPCSDGSTTTRDLATKWCGPSGRSPTPTAS
jgi:hypothetical protein